MSIFGETIRGIFRSQIVYDTLLNTFIVHDHSQRVAAKVEVNDGEWVKACGLEKHEFEKMIRGLSARDRRDTEARIRFLIDNGAQVVPIKVSVRRWYGLIFREVQKGIVLSEIWPEGRKPDEDRPFKLDDFNLLRLADSSKRGRNSY